MESAKDKKVVAILVKMKKVATNTDSLEQLKSKKDFTIIHDPLSSRQHCKL
jgi:hypothetical protein